MFTPARFANQVALTPGRVRLGRATALRMAAEGAAVVLLDLRPERVERVRAEVEAAGGAHCLWSAM